MWDSNFDDDSMEPPTESYACLYNLTIPLSVVVGTTCSLSMVGSVLIVLSYVMVPGIRTQARGILVNLSVMDFTVALANFIGICLKFNVWLGGEGSSHSNVSNIGVGKDLCIAQASVAMYATWSSILWTICIAVYIYFRVTTSEYISRVVLYSLYVVAYGLPAILVAWQLAADRFGFDRHAGSSWCSSVVSKHGKMLPFNVVFVNDIWMYLTVFLVIIILISLHFHFKREVNGRSILIQNAEVAVHRVEKKLLFIPVFFILLRMWSSVYAILAVEIGVRWRCNVSIFFIFASGIGDSGQGFTNAILYVFATPRVRSYFLRLLTCHTFPKRRINAVEPDSSWQSDQRYYSSMASSDSKRSEELNNNSTDKIPKSLLLNN